MHSMYQKIRCAFFTLLGILLISFFSLYNRVQTAIQHPKNTLNGLGAGNVKTRVPQRSKYIRAVLQAETD